MIYFVVAVLAITAVVQAVLLKTMENFYIEEQRLAAKYRAELEARLAQAEKEVKLLRRPTQEVDQQIAEAVSLANQERDINE